VSVAIYMVIFSLRACSVNPTPRWIEQDWSGSRDILTYIGFNPARSPPIQPVYDVTERGLTRNVTLAFLALLLCPSDTLFTRY
jgi:hypothetical protein